MGDGEGVGLVMTDANKFFYKSQVFHWFILMWTILRQYGFFEQLLVQNELIFNLGMKWMKPVFDNTWWGWEGRWGGVGKRCWHNIRSGCCLMMMLDHKGGRGGGSRIWGKVIIYYFLILCDIIAEFYLNFKFIILKTIMYSNCSMTSKHLWFIFKNIWSF